MARIEYRDAPRTTAEQSRTDKASTEGRTIAGYAAVFYNGKPGTQYTLIEDEIGIAVERIMPGAFNNALKRKDDVRLLVNHDRNLILARTASRTLRLKVDSIGLYYEAEVDESPNALNTVGAVGRGDISQSSFAFRIPPGGEIWTSTVMPDGRLMETRDIIDVELADVSAVTWPAYTGTTVYMRTESDVMHPAPSRSSFAPDDEFLFKCAKARLNMALAGVPFRTADKPARTAFKPKSDDDFEFKLRRAEMDMVLARN